MQVQKKRIKENNMESNYVVNVKTKVGTIITVRGNDATEFETNINALIGNGLNNSIAAMEELFLGTQPSQPSNTGVNTVVAALGGTVISETPIGVVPVAGFAPVAPPSSGVGVVVGTASRSCIHGSMTKREGVGPYGPYKAFMCPTPKGTPDQCKAIYLKANDPDYATF
jgi:hypothetical protein